MKPARPVTTLLAALLCAIPPPSAADSPPQPPAEPPPVKFGCRGGWDLPLASAAPKAPALLLDRCTGRTWTLGFGPSGLEWLPLPRLPARD